MRDRIVKVFDYAIKKKWFTGSNPARALEDEDEINVPMHRNNASIKENEISEFVAAVESSKADPQTKRAAKLLLYTFVRKQELLAAKQSEFDLEASLLMWGLCRSAPSALRVSFASKSIHAVLALRAYRT